MLNHMPQVLIAVEVIPKEQSPENKECLYISLTPIPDVPSSPKDWRHSQSAVL